MASLFKRSNGIYYVSYDDRGRRRWESTNLTDRDEALKFLANLSNPATGVQTIPALDAFTNDLLSCLDQIHSPKTVQNYVRALKHLRSITANKRIDSLFFVDI